MFPALLASAAAQGHEGHELPDASHGQASDADGLVVPALAGALLWWARRQ